jgi:hypothetical protein
VNLAQILHGELKASLQRSQEDLASTTSELEKHRQLNERLESDLMKIEQHGQGRDGQENGDANPVDAAEDDVLAGLGLELGLTTKDVRSPSYSPVQFLTSVLVEGSCGTNETYTFRILRQYIHSSHRHQPTRSLPSTQC